MTFLLEGEGEGGGGAGGNGKWESENKEVSDHDQMNNRRIMKYIKTPGNAGWCTECGGYTVYGTGCVVCSPRSVEDHERYRGIYEPDLDLLRA